MDVTCVVVCCGGGDAATYQAFVLCLFSVVVLIDIAQTHLRSVFYTVMPQGVWKGWTCWGKEAYVLKYAAELHYGRCRI